jgi:hypothetical protein
MQSIRGAKLRQSVIQIGQVFSGPTTFPISWQSNLRQTGGGSQMRWRRRATKVRQILRAILLSSLICHSAAPRRSGRIRKGKDPAPPTPEDVGHAPTRGKKRDQPEVIDESSEPTPRKRDAPTFNIVVNSPPPSRPKQRLRTNEAGDAADVPDVSESAPEQLWAATGDVRDNNCLCILLKLAFALGPMRAMH